MRIRLIDRYALKFLNDYVDKIHMDKPTILSIAFGLTSTVCAMIFGWPQTLLVILGITIAFTLLLCVFAFMGGVMKGFVSGLKS